MLGRCIKYYGEVNKSGINFILPKDVIKKKDKLLYLDKAKKMFERYKERKKKQAASS